MNSSTLPDMSGMDVLGLHISNPSSKAPHAHPYPSSIASSASSSSSSVFSLDASQSSVSSTATNPVDVIWENEGETLGRSVGTCPRAFAKGAAPKLDGAVPAELRMHPRRTNVATNGSAARPPPCLLRQSERKVNFVDNLVDTASQIVENIWPLSAVASRSDTTTGYKGVLPLRTFIQETLRRSRTSYSTLQVALYYLIKIKSHVPSHDFTKEQPRDQSCMRAMQCGRRMFLAALILASKYLQDRNYSARAWSKISGLNTLEINQNELMFLEAVGWRLHISEALFQRWTDLVLKLTPGAGGLSASEGQCWRTVLPRLTPDLESFEFEPMTPVSSGSMELVADSPSPRSAPSIESIRSTSREQTPTCPRSLPRTMDPTPRLEYAHLPMPTIPRPQMLPTPQMTPKSHVACTPAASATACGPRRSSIGTAMSQAQSLGMARSILDQRPPLSFCSRAPTYDGYPTAVRRSSLARSTSSTSSASSPDSMVSDVSTLSSRSSRSSSVSSSASGAGVSAPSRLAVTATLRCTSKSLKESRKILAIASPTDEASLADLYSSSNYPGAMGPAPDFSNFTMDSSLSEAAQSLCELSGATPERRQCRKRGRTGSEDLLLQNHVRHLIDAGASGMPASVLPDGQLAHSLLVPGGSSSLSGPAGMKRACCGSEAHKVALNPSIRADYLN
ncbi:G1/S-specific cyclin pas1 [Penicillium rolfsii]|nr:G1/S-specific cyclin pas1 [Penicillium rolfsii]